MTELIWLGLILGLALIGFVLIALLGGEGAGA